MCGQVFKCGWRRRSHSREARGKQSHVRVWVCAAGDAHTVEPAECFHKCKYWHLGWRRHWNQVSSDWQQHFVYLHSKITSRHHLQYIFTPGSTKVWRWTKDSNKCVCVFKVERIQEDAMRGRTAGGQPEGITAKDRLTHSLTELALTMKRLNWKCSDVKQETGKQKNVRMWIQNNLIKSKICALPIKYRT